MATWNEVDWDLWYSELVWMFLRNKEGVPEEEHAKWHWRTGHGPGQTYYKLSAKHAVEWDAANTSRHMPEASASGPAASPGTSATS